MMSKTNLSEEIGAEASASKVPMAGRQDRSGIKRVLARTRSRKALLKLQPFDVAPEQGRSVNVIAVQL